MLHRCVLLLWWGCRLGCALPGQRLRFVQQPSNGYAGHAWAVQPSVEVVVPDGAGEWMRDVVMVPANVTARVTPLTSVPFGWSSVTSVASLLDGVANFSGMSLSLPGEFLLLVDLPGFYPPLQSRPFNISIGTPTAFAILTQPGTGTGGLPLAPAPCVGIVDEGGNVVVLPGPRGVNVTIAGWPPVLMPGPGSSSPASQPNGTLFLPLGEDGTASFRNLTLGAAGVGYSLRFCLNDTSALPPGTSACVDSAAFAVGVGPTSRLVLLSEPSGAAGGHPFAVQPVVQLQDEGGNPNVADSYSSITVSIWTDPTRGGARLRPATLRRIIPPAVLNATLTTGSWYVGLSADPWVALPAQGEPQLVNGDVLAFGLLPPSSYNASSGSSGDVVMGEGAVYLPQVASVGTGPWDSPPWPPISASGVVVSSVRPGVEQRLRLAQPWLGPNMTGVAIARETAGLRTRVLGGLATFSQLTLDVAARGYVLLFESSMAPLPNSTAGAAPSDGVTYAQWNSLYPTGDTGPWAYGVGRVGNGFGYGGDAHSVLPGRVSVLSAPFSVVPGEPHHLSMLRFAGRAWAGNQPFGVQPVVGVADAGGNVLTPTCTDYTVVAGLLPPVNGTGAGFAPPASALLLGTAAVATEDGIAEYQDLGISASSGQGVFALQFSANVTLADGSAALLTASQLLSVAYSAEWQLTSFSGERGPGSELDPQAPLNATSTPGQAFVQPPEPGLPGVGDRFGHAIAVAGDVVVVSAPYTDAPMPEVQIVVVQGAEPAGLYTSEVQLLKLDAQWEPEVQLLTLQAGGGEGAAMSGSFVLSWGSGAPSRPIPVWSDTLFLQVVIQEDLLSVAGWELGGGGPGDVTLTPLLDAPGLRSWSVTFLNVYGVLPLLGVDGSGLGPGVNASTSRLAAATVLGGSFTLSLPFGRANCTASGDLDPGTQTALASDGPVPLGGGGCGVGQWLTTRALPYDVTATALGNALQQDLRTGPVAVYYEGPLSFTDNEYYGWGVGIRSWMLQFTPGPASYNVPTLRPGAAALTGTGAELTVSTLHDGTGPLGGTFLLSFRGSESPIPLDFNASAEEVQAALLATGQLVAVDVERVGPLGQDGGCAWAVTFTGVLDPASGRVSDGNEDDAPLGTANATMVSASWEQGQPPLSFRLTSMLAPSTGGSSDEWAGVDDWVPTGAAVRVPGLLGTGAQLRVLAYPSSASLSSDAFFALPGLDLGAITSTVAVTLGAPAGPTSGFLSGPREGSAGLQTGSAFVFGRTGPAGQWGPLQRLTASDGKELDLFGAGVALAIPPPCASSGSSGVGGGGNGSCASGAPAGSLLAVSAPGRRETPALEVQGLVCTAPLQALATNATSSSAIQFTLSFRGAVSPPILLDASLAALRAALESMPTVERVLVSGGGNFGSMCSGSGGGGGGGTVYVTFLAPQDGDLPALVPVLQVVDPFGVALFSSAGTAALSNASLGSVSITVIDDVVRGVAKSSGSGSTGALAGAVYLFEPTATNSSLTSSGGGAGGASPNATSTLPLPSSFNETAILTRRGAPEPWSNASAYDGFGWAVAAATTAILASSGACITTVAVGAPFDMTDGGMDVGAVFVYSRLTPGAGVSSMGSGAVYHASADDDPVAQVTQELDALGGGAALVWSAAIPQVLLGTTHDSEGGAGFRFGWSLAFDSGGLTLLVGAPGAGASGEGAVWVFKRQPPTPQVGVLGLAPFLFDQLLTPAAVVVPSFALLRSLPAGSAAGCIAALRHATGALLTPGCEFGHSVAFSDNVAVVGAPGALAATGAQSGLATGAALIYDRVSWGGLTGELDLGGYLTLRTTVVPEPAGSGDRVGVSVAASSAGVVVIGAAASMNAPNPNGVSGAVGVGAWDQAGHAVGSSGTPRHERQMIATGVEGGSGAEELLLGSVTLGGYFQLSFSPPQTPTMGHREAGRRQGRVGQWRQRGGDSGRGEGRHPRLSRPIPWNAVPSMVRRALEADLGTGRVMVRRLGPGTAGAYRWVVTFLELAPTRMESERWGVPVESRGRGGGGIPLLRVAAARLRVQAVNATAPAGPPGTCSLAAAASLREASNILGASPLWRLYDASGSSSAAVGASIQPTVSVTRLNSASLATRGAAYVLTRAGNATSIDAGYGFDWSPQVLLSPFAFQATDQFGASIAMGGDAGALFVGAPTRDVVDALDAGGSINAGAVFSYDLSLLNMASAVPLDPKDLSSLQSVSEGGGALLSPGDADDGAVPPLLQRLARGHYTGLGVTSATANVSFNLCVPSCRVPTVASLFKAAAAAAQPQAVAYASSVPGNDWGVYDIVGAAVPPGGGAVAARAHAAPATSAGGAKPLWGDLSHGETETGYAGAADSIAWTLGAGGGRPFSVRERALGDALSRGSIQRETLLQLGTPVIGSGLFPSTATAAEVGGGVLGSTVAGVVSSCITGASALGTDDCMFLRAQLPDFPSSSLASRSEFDRGGSQDFISTVTLLELSAQGAGAASVPLYIVGDTIVEAPNELLHVRLSLPGLSPLWGSPLWTSLQIVDDGDGSTAPDAAPSTRPTVQQQQLFYGSRPVANASELWAAAGAGGGNRSIAAPRCVLANGSSPTIPPESTAGFRFGSSLALDPSGTVAVVGAPGAPCPCGSCGLGSDPQSPLGSASVMVAAGRAWRTVALLDPGAAATAAAAAAAVSTGNGSTPAPAAAAPRFGTAVAMYTLAGSRTFAAVSAPGLAMLRMFSWNTTALSLSAAAVVAQGTPLPALDVTLEAELTPDTTSLAAAAQATAGAATLRALNADDRFGGPRAVALGDDGAGGILLVVGCPGLEAVFIFRYTAGGEGIPASTLGASAAGWMQTMILRASDYAEVPTLLSAATAGMSPQRQGSRTPVVGLFGASVSLSRQTLVIGAPKSRYNASATLGGATGTGQTYDETQAAAAAGGMGAVYVLQLVGGVTLADYSPVPIHHVSNNWAALAGWASGDAAAARGQAVYTYDDAGGDALWVQQAVLVADDGRAGDAFGSSVAVDGASVIVGAPGAGNTPNVTWSFETGDLQGWTARGGAFARQPTFGDNPLWRAAAYKDALDGARRRPAPAVGGHDRDRRRGGGGDSGGGDGGSSSACEGRYWIGTYEARPPDLPPNFNVSTMSDGDAGGVTDGIPEHWAPADAASPPSFATSPPGAAQGDVPTGSLTSSAFRIPGRGVTGGRSGDGPLSMSVLVGGGCDDTLVYVELLVDGVSVLRASGGCSEEMRRVSWDLRPFAGRAGVVRIVDDASSGPWGHINVDDFRFSWNIGAFVESDASGAVYIFERVAGPGVSAVGAYMATAAAAVAAATGGGIPLGAYGFPPSSLLHSKGRGEAMLSQPCGPSAPPLSCLWQRVSRLSPAEKRAGAQFGWDVAMDDATGIAVVAEGPVTTTGPRAPHSGGSNRPGAGPLAAAVNGMGHFTLATERAGQRRLQATATSARRLAMAALGGTADVTGSSGSAAYELYGQGDEDAPLPPGSNDLSALLSIEQQQQQQQQQQQLRSKQWGDDGDGSSLSHPSLLPAAARARGGQGGIGLGGLGLYTDSPTVGSGQENLFSGVHARDDDEDALETRRGGLTGLAYVIRSEPPKRVGGGALLSNRAWPALTSDGGVTVLEVAASAAEGGDGERFPARGLAAASAVAVKGMTALFGCPQDSRLGPYTGSAWAFHLGYAFLTLDPRDWTSPAETSGVTGNFNFASSYEIGPDFTVIIAFTVSEGNRRGEVNIPVYRPGMNTGVGGGVAREPAAFASETLVIHFATRDGTATAVTATQAAACAVLPLADRAAARCGDYVQQAGELVFPPGVSRRDVLIPLMDDDASESTETFSLDLWVPGGAQIRGSGYSVTVRIDDDDGDDGGR